MSKTKAHTSGIQGCIQHSFNTLWMLCRQRRAPDYIHASWTRTGEGVEYRWRGGARATRATRTERDVQERAAHARHWSKQKKTGTYLIATVIYSTPVLVCVSAKRLRFKAQLPLLPVNGSLSSARTGLTLSHRRWTSRQDAARHLWRGQKEEQHRVLSRGEDTLTSTRTPGKETVVVLG